MRKLIRCNNENNTYIGAVGIARMAKCDCGLRVTTFTMIVRSEARSWNFNENLDFSLSKNKQQTSYAHVTCARFSISQSYGASQLEPMSDRNGCDWPILKATLEPPYSGMIGRGNAKKNSLRIFFIFRMVHLIHFYSYICIIYNILICSLIFEFFLDLYYFELQ